MTTQTALILAHTLKQELLRRGLPVRQVYLFGSFAKGTARPHSDIDVAIVCDPFAASRHEENIQVRQARWDIDMRIEPVCLHPQDFEDRYFTLAQEVKRHGIGV